MAVIKVLIVDDHAMLRAGLKSLLDAEPDIEVVGEAADGSEALDAADRYQPDIVLLDVTMPHMNGMDCLKVMRERFPSVKVILLTMHDDALYLKEGLRAGASGYVVKKAADSVLYNAIRTVYAGEVFIPGSMAKILISGLTKQKADDVNGKGPIRPLSDQETKVLKLMALGHTNAEIAAQLNLSVKTVETYKYRLMEKLNTSKRSDLVKYAMENRIISL